MLPLPSSNDYIEESPVDLHLILGNQVCSLYGDKANLNADLTI